jgi:hypothetical protein
MTIVNFYQCAIVMTAHGVCGSAHSASDGLRLLNAFEDPVWNGALGCAGGPTWGRCRCVSATAGPAGELAGPLWPSAWSTGEVDPEAARDRRDVRTAQADVLQHAILESAEFPQRLSMSVLAREAFEPPIRSLGECQGG